MIRSGSNGNIRGIVCGNIGLPVTVVAPGGKRTTIKQGQAMEVTTGGHDGIFKISRHIYLAARTSPQAMTREGGPNTLIRHMDEALPY